MFINCPQCRALVATDPVTDAPPELCPRCSTVLRQPDAALEIPAETAEPVIAIAVAAQSVETESSTPVPTDFPTTVSIAPEDSGAMDERNNSIEQVSADVPVISETASGTETTQPAMAPDAVATSISEPDVESTDDAQNGIAPATGPSVEAIPASAASIARTKKPAPSFVVPQRATAGAPSRTSRILPTAIGVATVVLLLQLLLADRESFAANARWRPVITTLCAALRCSVPAWHEPNAFTMLERNVRPHSTIPGALRVTASFRNDARWPQPWPQMTLTLSDVDGREAGTRRFTANEYLGAAPTQPVLESGQTATIAMDVIEPAPRIVAFTFEFH